MNDPQFLIFAKFLLALFLGALIGVERELSDKPAGIRTHTIVAGAACLLVSLNDFMAERPVNGWVDPESRFLIDAIITGVSFLGAGTIIQGGRGRKVEGLTTAASILMSAVVGIYVAFWKFWIAAGIALVTLGILHSFGLIDKAKKKYSPGTPEA